MPLAEARALERVPRGEKRREREWLLGHVQTYDGDAIKARVSFNRELHAWHYGWVSTKQTSNALHSFRVRVFSQAPGADMLTLLGSVCSSRFRLFSRRRGIVGPARAVKRAAAFDLLNLEADRAAFAASGPARQPAKRSRWLSGSWGAWGVLGSSEQGAEEGVQREREREAEMDANRAIDRLTQLCCHYTSGGDESGNLAPLSLSSASSGVPLPLPLPLPVTMPLPLPMPSQLPMCGSDFGAMAVDDHVASLLADMVPGDHERRALVKQTSWSSSSSGSSSGKSSSSPPSSSSDSASALRRLGAALREHCGLSASAAATAIDKLERVSETLLRLLCRNETFDALVTMWNSPSGREALRTQLAMEKDERFTWTREHEDETFVPAPPGERPAGNVERSIFAEHRHAIRTQMRKALEACGLTLGDFAHLLEAAVARGLVPNDLSRPPTVEHAAFMHMQLRGDLKGFEAQDYGSRAGAFKDEAQQAAFAKAFLLLRRSRTRRVVFDRLVEDQRNKHAMLRSALTEAPMEADLDLTGTWLRLDTEAELDESCRRRARLMCFMMGRGKRLGTFVARMGARMFGNVKLKVSKRTLTISGEAVLMARPRTCVNLDGGGPLPAFAFGPLVSSRLIVGWTQRTPQFSSIHLVISGFPVAAKLMDNLALLMGPVGGNLLSAKSDDDLGDDDWELGVRRFLASGSAEGGSAAGGAQAGAMPQPTLLQHVEVRVAKGRTTCMEMVRSSLLFRSASDAPPLEDLDAIKRFEYGNTMDCLVVDRTTKTYIRNYASATDTELIHLLVP